MSFYGSSLFCMGDLPEISKIRFEKLCLLAYILASPDPFIQNDPMIKQSRLSNELSTYPRSHRPTV